VPPVAVGGCDVGELDVLTLFVAEALRFRCQGHHGAAWDRREFVEVDTPHVVQRPTTHKNFEHHHYHFKNIPKEFGVDAAAGCQIPPGVAYLAARIRVCCSPSA